MPNPVPALREPQVSSPAKTWAAPRAAAARAHGAALLVFLAALPGAGGCNSSSQTTSRPLCIAGSTSVQPFAEKLAEVYMHRHPGVRIDVQGGGSSAGIYAATQGAADLGASSRELVEAEKALHEIPIAWDGIAVIVHPSNPLNNLNMSELRQIFQGTLNNWRDLGYISQP